MNFDFDDDIKIMKGEARRFLKAESPLAACRRILESTEPYDKVLWRRIAAMGWTAVTIPQEFGGMGLGHLALCALAEELGYALSPLPFSSSVCLATEALLLEGNKEQKQHWLPRLASGEAVGTFAIAEKPGFVDPERLSTRYTDGRINGVKVAVTDGRAADFVVVAALGESGPVLCIVDLGSNGIRREPTDSIDPTRPQARIVFERAEAQLLGSSKSGAATLNNVLNRAAVLFAFEQVGGAQAALDMACNFARERYAFGRPIGSYQGIKHNLANIYAAIEIARSNAYYAAWAISQDVSELPVAAATARAAATDAFWFAARENVHVHGGLGYTWDYDCQFHYRRSKLLGLALGSSFEWKERLLGHLEAQFETELPNGEA